MGISCLRKAAVESQNSRRPPYRGMRIGPDIPHFRFSVSRQSVLILRGKGRVPIPSLSRPIVSETLQKPSQRNVMTTTSQYRLLFIGAAMTIVVIQRRVTREDPNQWPTAEHTKELSEKSSRVSISNFSKLDYRGASWPFFLGILLGNVGREAYMRLLL